MTNKMKPEDLKVGMVFDGKEKGSTYPGCWLIANIVNFNVHSVLVGFHPCFKMDEKIILNADDVVERNPRFPTSAKKSVAEGPPDLKIGMTFDASETDFPFSPKNRGPFPQVAWQIVEIFGNSARAKCIVDTHPRAVKGDCVTFTYEEIRARMENMLQEDPGLTVIQNLVNTLDKQYEDAKKEAESAAGRLQSLREQINKADIDFANAALLESTSYKKLVEARKILESYKALTKTLDEPKA